MSYTGFLHWSNDPTKAELLLVYQILMYRFLPVDTLLIYTSTGLRQNIGTPTGRLGKNFGLFPYYDIYLRVLKLDGLAIIFPTKPYSGV
jgi:hypothetical protein